MKFRVGDVVTWGAKAIAHRVVEVTESGLYVDASSVGFGSRYFVSWSGNGAGGLEVAGFGPDVLLTPAARTSCGPDRSLS